MKNKILALLLSVAIAFGLWLYVITVVNPESEKTYYEIPVVLQNKEILTERGLMVVGDLPTVTLVLKGNRTTLNELNEANINVITNVANIEKAGTHQLTYQISYPGNVSDNEISVQKSSSDFIKLQIENRINKTVPVVVDDGDTAVPPGFILGSTQLDKTDIEIAGPAPVVNQITQAIIRVDLNNQTKTLVGEYQYTLCDKAGEPVDAEKVSTDTEKVNLMIKIERLKEIALHLGVEYGGGANESNTVITMSQTALQVSGSDALLENVSSPLDLGTIKLDEIDKDTVLTIPIPNLPEGVTNRTGVDEVTVEIKFNNLVKKEFIVTNIAPVNVAAGLNVGISQKQLKVVMRGSQELIDLLTPADISATVDLSGVKPGTYEFNGTISVNSAFVGVGAIGVYPIAVTVS